MLLWWYFDRSALSSLLLWSYCGVVFRILVPNFFYFDLGYIFRDLCKHLVIDVSHPWARFLSPILFLGKFGIHYRMESCEKPSRSIFRKTKKSKNNPFYIIIKPDVRSTACGLLLKQPWVWIWRVQDHSEDWEERAGGGGRRRCQIILPDKRTLEKVCVETTKEWGERGKTKAILKWVLKSITH